MACLHRMFIYFLLSAVYADKCIKWQCSTLPSNICAVWNDDEVLINSMMCPDGKICSMLELEMRLVWFREGTLECEENIIPKKDKVKQCKSYNGEQRLEAEHPALCESDLDCLRSDGTHAKCRCAFDGRKFCTYSSGDLEAEVYHDMCGRMSEEDAYHLHIHYHLQHILFTAPQPCVGIFVEAHYYKYFKK
jgi:hypothetical protein